MSANEVFEARNEAELAARYDEWAASYESDMGDHGGPAEAVQALARYVAPVARILDAGCGTGLAGQLLASRGYRNIEGLDLSEGMLREAGKKNCYTALHRQRLGEPLDFETGVFEAVLAVGVFARAHAPSRSLIELTRIVKPGGYVIFTLRPEFYVATDFKQTMADLTDSGGWRLVETTEPFDGRFKEFPGINLQVWIFQVLGKPFRRECIHHLVEEQVARTPQAIALIADDQRLTYAELNSRSNRVAHHLIGLGAGPETLVGICANRSAAMLVGMLGILKAGAAYVALDPKYPRVRQAFMIEDAAMPIVLTQQDLVDSLPVTPAKLICLDSDWSAIARESDTNPGVPVRRNNLAYILYTSGSTGRPKGVAIEHRSVVVFLIWAYSVFSLEELQGTLAATSICFDLSVFEIFVPLTRGGTVILAENALALPAFPARNEVTLINTVPSAMTALIHVGGVPAGVQVVNLAGEPLPNKLVQDIYAVGVQKVFNLYGPSEDTTYSTYVLCEKDATKNPSIGRPILNTQAYIVDEHLQRCGIGITGELCLGGEGLARGYLNRPELTEAKFLPNPFGPGRIYRTGDLAAYLPDGNIEFQGRKDYQVKVRGFRIELGEIETALETHPAVERAIVLALPDARGELHLSAYLAANASEVEKIARTQDSDEHVSLWRNVYEDIYRQGTNSDELDFNTTGWQSSYTGRPIPSEEMHEWLDRTVERILAFEPRDVLELGCGTGMILARVAPHCNRYVGLDIAPAALDHIREMQRSRASLDRVTLLERSADELSDFSDESFDLIVINSVVQHFPDVDYLVRLLTDATRLLKPGGAIFIGDVINFNLLETFHASVELHRASDSSSAATLKQRIRQQIDQERDLALAPGLFTALAQEQPAITHVEALPRRGRFNNQLNRFRYDVILRVGKEVEALADPEWIDWQRPRLNLTEMRHRLESRPETLAIRNIPNARLEQDITTLAWLREAGDAETIDQLREHLTQQPKKAIDPEDLTALKELGYRVALSWLNTDSSGAFDAFFERNDLPHHDARFYVRDKQANHRSWQDFANHPYRAKLNRQLIPRIREFLEDKLPHYMMPSAFTVLDTMPLSPSGKVDRRALAQLPSSLPAEPEQSSAVPLKPLEELLVRAWAEALNLDRVGVNDDFFALGGSSLTAMALTHSLQKSLHRPLRPATLMQAPTPAQFAAYLSTLPACPANVVASGSAGELHEGEI